jgi:hypothetical protein
VDTLGLGDRIRNFFAKKNNPELAGLESFLGAAEGVEGYIEPKTATNPASLLLVDREGRHQRAPVREPEDAVAFCERHGIPIYDVNVMGYPQRMKDYQRGKRSSGSLDEAVLADLEKRLSESDPETPNN